MGSEQPRRPRARRSAETYSYNCVDQSFVLPYYKKYYVALFHRCIPARMPANIITLASACFMGVLAPLCVFGVWQNRELFGALCALLVHNYLLGDHLDGMQAKATGTSSSLGEFLDHFLDIFNGALMAWAGFCLLMGQQHLLVLNISLYFYFMVFATTMMEERETGYLHFGRWGSLESFLLMILFFLSWTVPALQRLWLHPLGWGLDARWLYLGGSAFGLLFTVVAIRLRMGYWPRQTWIFSLGALALAVLLSYLTRSQVLSFLVLAFYSADYIGRMQGSFFLDRPHPYPDLPVTVAAATLLPLHALGLVPAGADIFILSLLAIYLSVRMALGPGEVIYQMRGQWRWANN